MTARKVTDADIRDPAFAGVSLDDLEFAEDGTVQRRDRWKTSYMALVSELEANQIASITARDFTLPVVESTLKTFVQTSALPDDEAPVDKAALLLALSSARVLSTTQRETLAALVTAHVPDPV